MSLIISFLVAILNIFYWFIIIHVIMSWLLALGVVNFSQQFVRRLWEILTSVLEPIYQPIRRVIPNIGGLDLTPLVVIFIIIALQRILYAAL